MSLSSTTLSVLVRSRITNYYTGNAKAISSRNDKGPFDILPMHAHFITLIRDMVTIHISPGNDMRISLSQGVLKVKDDFVQVYIGIDKKTQ